MYECSIYSYAITLQLNLTIKFHLKTVEWSGATFVSSESKIAYKYLEACDITRGRGKISNTRRTINSNNQRVVSHQNHLISFIFAKQ